MRPAAAATLVLLLLLAPTASAAAAGRDGGAAPAAARRTRAGMVRLPAGTYRPLYPSPSLRSESGQAAAVAVRAFWLDRDPVTRGAFLAFARANAEWAREAGGGTGTDLARPATGVSWFAARAYCASLGKRLPTLHEWEYAAAASETQRDATRDPAFVQRLVSLYATRPRPLPPVHAAGAAAVPNAYGVRALHGLAWEWVAEQGHDHHAHASHASHASQSGDASCAGAAIGAADPSNYPAFLRLAMRSGLTPRSTLESLGFRCAA